MSDSKMTSILALCLLLFFLVQKTSCTMRIEKLRKFQTMVENKHAAGFAPPRKFPFRGGRVFYPSMYGADPTGQKDSTFAIIKAITDAFSVQKGLELLPGVNDLGGVEIDLLGGNYKISQPLTLPPNQGNVLIKGGTLRASDIFPGDRYLIELRSPNSKSDQNKTESDRTNNFYNRKDFNNANIQYQDITFQDILFDSSFKGGGIFILDSAAIKINNCMFIRFTTEGIIVKRGHETYISNTFLGQHLTVGGDPMERNYTGTAIDLEGNDNAVTDVVIFSAATGVLLGGEANILTGVHCYNKATGFGGVGILVKSKPDTSSLTRIDNCYLDYTGITLEDPVQVHVTNGMFLGDANVLIRSVNGNISGVNIVDNMFLGNHQGTPIVHLDGEFSNIDQVVVERNNAVGMALKSTVGKMAVSGNGTKWVADFSELLVFPNKINHIQYSMFVPGGLGAASPSYAVTSVANNTVVLESRGAETAVASVEVDQYNLPGEKNPFQ